MKYEALQDVNKNSKKTGQIPVMFTGNISTAYFNCFSKCQNNDIPCTFY